jgi:hypothetical protein
MMWPLLIASARAEDGAPVEAAPPDDPVEIVIVEGDLRVARERAELEAAIQDLGYRGGVNKGDRVVFRPEIAWKPTIVLYDDGRIALKRSPVRFGLDDDLPKGLYALCPIRPDLCVRLGGQVIAPRKLDGSKEAVLEATRTDHAQWTEALVDRNMTDRRDQAVPDALDALWTRGAAMDGGPPIEDVAARRAAILDFWASRTCTDAGDAIADVAAAFIRNEIQSGPDAASAEEIGAYEAACTCDRALDL